MLRRVLGALLVLAVLVLGTRGLVRFLAPAEAKIRRLVEQMEDAYNAGKPGTCVGPLARDWRHEGHSIDRQMLLGGLFQAARERDPETRELRSRVAVDDGTLSVTVDGERAELSAEATFSRLSAGEWREAWRARFEAELEHGDDGWKIVRSRHADVAGTHLGR
jgi:hypothetical protein